MICLLFYPLADALCSLFAGIIRILVGNVGEKINYQQGYTLCLSSMYLNIFCAVVVCQMYMQQHNIWYVNQEQVNESEKSLSYVCILCFT